LSYCRRDDGFFSKFLAVDSDHLEPMLHRIDVTAGALPHALTTDAGYWSEDKEKACAEQGIDAYIATGRLPHGQPLPPKL
jgi:hypothetical protein